MGWYLVLQWLAVLRQVHGFTSPQRESRRAGTGAAGWRWRQSYATNAKSAGIDNARIDWKDARPIRSITAAIPILTRVGEQWHVQQGIARVFGR
jgi:hypothetical protein